jgi:predicted RNA-binding Zn ribbon-like protein
MEGSSWPAATNSCDGRLEFPVLGEPFAVEFANTLYGHGNNVIDFLGTSDLVVGWFVAVGGTFVLPARLRAPTASSLRAIRDATRQLFEDVIGGAEPASQHSIATLNQSARQASAHLHLDWPPADAPRAGLRHQGDADTVLVVRVASECIAFLAGPDREHLRRCDRPGCYMIFVQQHHRRRYCNDLCARSDRQSRYYRRTTENRSARGHDSTTHRSSKKRGTVV